MEQSVQKGYLSCCFRGAAQDREWQQRFYVLHSSSSGCQARLDFYDNELNYKEKSNVHGTMYIGDIDDIRACKDKVKNHTFELVLKSGKIRTFATESAKDLAMWLHFLRAEKAGGGTLEKSSLIPSGMISLHGSQNSLDRDESSSFDENVLYESAENPDIFQVEVIDSPASQRNNLSGAYSLRINTLNMMLADRGSSRPVLIWPYRYIRRYGRSKTTFTFEAGRKCTSGEGYFTFKADSGDTVFTVVQKRTKEMKKKASSNASPGAASKGATGGQLVEPDDVSPALPARKYDNEPTATDDSVTKKVKMFEQGGVQPPIAHKPPMLQKMKPPVAKKPSLESLDGNNRITQGYELGKTVFPVSAKDGKTPLPRYEDSDRPKTVDVSYKETDHPNGNARSPGSPVYAVYDIARSSRYPDGPVYDDPASPYESAVSVKSFATTTSFVYAEPCIPGGDAWRTKGRTTDNIHVEHYAVTGGDIEADGAAIYEEPDRNVKSAAKLSEISNRLKKQNMGDSEYDHIAVHKTLPSGKQREPLPAIPGNSDDSEYGQLFKPKEKIIRNPFAKKKK